jgi:glutamine amidotransferase
MRSAAPKVAIVDYSLGNLFSVQQACARVGLEGIITSSKDEILAAAAVILPGVGAFGDAMDNLRRLDLVSPLRDLAQSDTPLVGICLGQQLLMSESFEFGRHRGLGIFEGQVVRFDQPRAAGGILKVPQVGWNRIHVPGNRRAHAATLAGTDGWNGSPLTGLADGAFMYFVHSFYVQPADAGVVLATTRYGHLEFCSSLCRRNVAAFQFHPERSGQDGMRIYRNIASQLQTPAAGAPVAHASGSPYLEENKHAA